MNPGDLPKEVRDAIGTLSEKILRETGTRLAHEAINAAMLGSSISYLMRVGRKPGEPIESAPSAIVLLLAGPIPDDVCDSLENWMRATQQDLRTSGLFESGARETEEKGDE